MTTHDNKSGHRHRGRPRGLGPRITCLVHGAYAKDLNQVYIFWKKHSPHIAARVDIFSDSYARWLGWQKDNPNYNKLRELAILTISRELLMIKIIDLDFTRHVRDAQTGVEIKQRPCDQFKRLEEIDDEIQELSKALGL